MDNLTPAQRTKNMSNIRSKNTRTELAFAKALKRTNIKYRKHPKIEGKPDFFLPESNTVIFLDGCFWHKCPKHFRKPMTNRDYWAKKIQRNVKRDKEITKKLKQKYKVTRIFECQIKKGRKRIEGKGIFFPLHFFFIF